jgi:glycosyltransferase involved in cell wall biosynthesis
MTRRALIVTYHFPPSAASGTFRLLGFARHLPRFGWRVHVVAPPEMPWDPVDPALSAQVPPGTGYDAVAYPRRAPRLLRLFAPYSIWLPLAWRACRRLIDRRRPDVVLTSGPPHVVHLLGLLLQRTDRLPWIADFRDPWISGMIEGRLSVQQRWLRYLEKQIIAHADRVVANAPNAATLFQATYRQYARKVVTLTNGFDPPAQPAFGAGLPPAFGAGLPTPPPSRPAPAAPITGTIRMLHAGEIYAGRDPLPLLDAMAELKQAGVALRLEVMGSVHLPRGDLVTEAARRGLAADVLVRGQLPYQEALQEMAKSDLLVLLNGPGRRVGVPAKLYEYFGAGRPILALTEPDGDTAEILRASGIQHGIAPPKDVGRIRQVLAELAGAPRIQPDQQRLRRFTRESLAGDMAAIMEQVVRS